MPPPIPLFTEGCMNCAGSQASSANNSSKDGSRRSNSSGRELAEDLAFCTDLMNRLRAGQSRIHCSWFASVFIRGKLNGTGVERTLQGSASLHCRSSANLGRIRAACDPSGPWFGDRGRVDGGLQRKVGFHATV